MDKTKTCVKCGISKPTTLEYFYEDKRRKDGLYSWCKTCHKEYCRKYNKDNPASHRNVILKRDYGITNEEYAFLLLGQEGLCAICGKTPQENGRALAVDHYEIGDKKIIRGLLCVSCNRGIGYLQHNIEILEDAIKYLKEHK